MIENPRHDSYALHAADIKRRLRHLNVGATMSDVVKIVSTEPVFEVNAKGQGIKAVQEDAPLQAHLNDASTHALLLHAAARNAMHALNEELDKAWETKRTYTLTVQQDTIIKADAYAQTTIRIHVRRST